MNTPATFKWTDAITARAVTLHKEGQSAAQIANAIGAPTRNAVAGKLHRLGVTRDHSADRTHQTRSLQSKLAAISRARIAKQDRTPKPPPRPFPIPAASAPIPDTGRLTGFRICDPEFGGCRWPLSGERDQMRFCCVPVEPGVTYCPAHKARSVNTAQPTKKRDGRLANYLARKAA